MNIEQIKADVLEFRRGISNSSTNWRGAVDIIVPSYETMAAVRFANAGMELKVKRPEGMEPVRHALDLGLYNGYELVAEVSQTGPDFRNNSGGIRQSVSSGGNSMFLHFWGKTGTDIGVEVALPAEADDEGKYSLRFRSYFSYDREDISEGNARFYALAQRLLAGEAGDNIVPDVIDIMQFTTSPRARWHYDKDGEEMIATSENRLYMRASKIADFPFPSDMSIVKNHGVVGDGKVMCAKDKMNELEVRYGKLEELMREYKERLDIYGDMYDSKGAYSKTLKDMRRAKLEFFLSEYCGVKAKA